MNKQQELKSLTWKYFWQQKIAEVTLTLLIIAAIVFIPYLLGHNIGDSRSEWCDTDADTFRQLKVSDCPVFYQWSEGVGYILIVAVILFVLAWGLKEWVKCNWSKAHERAKSELNRRRSRSKIVHLSKKGETNEDRS